MNREHGEPAVEIEPELVEAVLDEVQAGELGRGDATASAPRSRAHDDAAIETPYLQLVMTRLWDDERAAGSRDAALRR